MTTGPGESVLELLVLQETKVARLYEAFAGRDPERRDFWQAMAAGEHRHVAMIRELQGHMPARQALLVEGKVRAGAIKAFLSYVDGLILRVEKEGIPFAKALSLSMDIERSLVEKGMLDHFHGASVEVKALLAKLRKETGDHFALLEETWKRNRPA